MKAIAAKIKRADNEALLLQQLFATDQQNKIAITKKPYNSTNSYFVNNI
jgi:hypothetical protein